MRVSSRPCKRGNFAKRSKSGHCLCNDCIEFRRSRWRQKNERRAEYKKDWLQRNPDKQKQYEKKWKEKNKERRREIEKSWRARNPEKVKEYNAKAGRKWSQNNKGKRLSSVRARQLAKRHRTPPWVCMEEISKIYELSAKISKQTGVPHEVDHIIPLQGDTVSGLHVPWNLQIITRTENRRKANKL